PDSAPVPRTLHRVSAAERLLATFRGGPSMKTLNPKTWAKPKGYANGIAARGTMIFVAGQIGWNGEKEKFESDDFVAQTRQALENNVAVLAESGAKPEHLVHLTWYIIDKQ